MWSLGCIIGEMITGSTLFPGNSTRSILKLIEEIIKTQKNFKPILISSNIEPDSNENQDTNDQSPNKNQTEVIECKNNNNLLSHENNTKCEVVLQKEYCYDLFENLLKTS